MTAAPNALRLNPADNVVVAMRQLEPGEPVAGEAVAAAEAIPSGTRSPTRPIRAGEIVRKYGQVIGAATADIAPGGHVHTQNLAMSALRAKTPGAGPRCNARSRRAASGATGARTARSGCATTRRADQR